MLISCPANQTSNTDPGQSTALVVWQDPSATDNSGDRPTVVCNPPSGTSFPIGSTKVTYTALDGYGNTDSCSFYVDIIGKIVTLSHNLHSLEYLLSSLITVS